LPASSPSLRRSTARAGAAARWHKPDIEDARRELAAERISSFVQRVLADAPPLSDEQRDRLALLLCGPSTPGGVGA
jgi:hypothetical protein